MSWKPRLAGRRSRPPSVGTRSRVESPTATRVPSSVVSAQRSSWRWMTKLRRSSSSSSNSPSTRPGQRQRRCCSKAVEAQKVIHVRQVPSGRSTCTDDSGSGSLADGSYWCRRSGYSRCAGAGGPAPHDGDTTGSDHLGHGNGTSTRSTTSSAEPQRRPVVSWSMTARPRVSGSRSSSTFHPRRCARSPRRCWADARASRSLTHRPPRPDRRIHPRRSFTPTIGTARPAIVEVSDGFPESERTLRPTSSVGMGSHRPLATSNRKAPSLVSPAGDKPAPA